MLHPRAEFWQWVLVQLEHFAGVETLERIARRLLQQQQELLDAGPTEAAELNPDWIGGLRGRGHPQAFFLPWKPADRTAVHAHPNRMLVVVLRGRLEITNYAADASARLDTRTLVAGQWITGVSDAQGYDHFPHVITAPESALSFHLYGDDPALGRRYPARA